MTNLTENQTYFLSRVVRPIVEDSNKRNLLPSPRIAQAILESGWGTSKLAKNARNLFGLKDNNQWDGKIYNINTGEFYDGAYTTVSANFQYYETWEESIFWQGWYLENRKFSENSTTYVYGNLKGVRDYKQFCKLLKEDGYATSPDYAEKLINLIELYNLTQYDVDAVPVGPDVATPVKRLALTVGHSILKTGNCTSADGRAFGGVLEYAYNKDLAPLIKKWVEKANWSCDVIVCPEGKFATSKEESTYKLPIVNSGKYDLVCELHLNASAAHNGSGEEVLYLSDSGKAVAQAISDRLSTIINKHGSGIVYRNNLYMLTKTKPTSVMIEGFFCDNRNDAARMTDKNKVAKLIAEGLVGHTINNDDVSIVVPESPVPDPNPQPEKPVEGNKELIRYWIQCGAFSVPENANRRVTALKLDGIGSFVKKLNGLNVVQAGAFTTEKAAKDMVATIQEKGYAVILHDKEAEKIKE